MIYIDGKRVYSPYEVKIVSSIIPESVEVYPNSLIYGTDYRSGSKNKKNESGEGFTVEAMTDYKYSEDGEEFFFTPLLTCMTYEDVHSVGFVIDLGENKDVDILQMRIWGLTYNVKMVVEISDDNSSFSVTNTVIRPTHYVQGVCQFKINKNARYIRFSITYDDDNYKWWKNAIIVRSVEIFAPTQIGTIKVASKEKQ